MECIRKIKSQWLALQSLVIRWLVILGCLINFLIKILAELSPYIFLIFPLNFDSTSTLNSSHSF
jgi:hypothetical protein